MKTPYFFDRLTYSSSQFLKYCVSGVIASVANVVGFALARFVTSYSIAVALGCLLGILSSMMLNRWFVFIKSGNSLTVAVASRFIAIHTLGCAVIYIVAVYAVPVIQALVSAPLRVIEAMALIVGIAVATPISFALHKFITFKARRA